MKKILNFNKKTLYGVLSTTSIIMVFAILLFVNLVVSNLNIKFDLTTNQIFSISQATVDVLNQLEEEVNIFVLHNESQTIELFDITTRILQQYDNASRYINLEFKNPNTNPQFINQFLDNKPILNGSIIVESNGVHKVIPVEHLYTLDLNEEEQLFLRSINVESQLTNAIIYVTTGRNVTVYQVIGNNEKPISPSLHTELLGAGYEIQEIDLFGVTKIPYDADILWISTPTRDWATKEVEVVRDYLQNGGSAIFFVDFSVGSYPNLFSLLESYGLEHVGGVIVEPNLGNMFPNDPSALIPNILSHSITDGIIQEHYNILMPLPTAINEATFVRDLVNIEPLLTTSRSAFSKMGDTPQSINKEDGDIEGPFTTAFAITDLYNFDIDNQTRLVVVTSEYILDPTINEIVRGANYNFILNSVNWTQGEYKNVFIRPKSMANVEMLTMTGANAVQILVFSVFILPLAIIQIGIFIWSKRRKA